MPVPVSVTELVGSLNDLLDPALAMGATLGREVSALTVMVTDEVAVAPLLSVTFRRAAQD